MPTRLKPVPGNPGIKYRVDSSYTHGSARDAGLIDVPAKEKRPLVSVKQVSTVAIAA